MKLALAVGCSLKPDIIVLNGDIIDNWAISTFVKNPQTPNYDVSYEIERTKGFLKELRHLFPKSRIVYIFGNHEYRWIKYIFKNADKFKKLKKISLEEQLETTELDIEVINSGNKENVWLYGKILIGHFNKVNKYSGLTAKNLVEEKSISIIQAHTHRGGCSYKRLYDRDIVGYENFCLCDRNPEYADHPNWQLGFSIIYKDINSDYFQVDQHYIAEIKKGNRTIYKTRFNGIFYEA